MALHSSHAPSAELVRSERENMHKKTGTPRGNGPKDLHAATLGRERQRRGKERMDQRETPAKVQNAFGPVVYLKTLALKSITGTW